MNLFESVKEAVTARQAAERYGIEIRRSGMACCPFHDDRTPSMKLDERFHCFGCGADGDVIDFAAHLFGLGKLEAAEKLAEDFGVVFDGRAPPVKVPLYRKADAERYREAECYCFRILAAYFHLLQQWEAELSPQTPEDSWHPRYEEPLRMKNYVEYLLDIFIEGTIVERAQWIAEHGKDVMKLEKRISEIESGADGVGHADGRHHSSFPISGRSSRQSGSD